MLHSPLLAIDGIGGGCVVPAVACIADPFLVPCGLAWSDLVYCGRISFISQTNNLFTPFAYRFDADFTAAPARLNIEDFVPEPNEASLKQRNTPSAVKMHTQKLNGLA